MSPKIEKIPNGESNEPPPMCHEPGSRLFPYPELREQDRHYMESYRCKSVDNGILNNYVLNYVYDFSVEHILPSWLAPNILTLCGPIFNIVTCAFTLSLPSEVTSPSSGSSTWSLLNVCATFSILWFLFMDNVDGKHARHIKWCSPLGDWLDHALDPVSYITIMNTLSTLIGFDIGLSVFAPAFVICTYQLVLWETLLCGELVINAFESCSEGMFLFAVLHSLMAFFGDPTPALKKVLFTLPIEIPFMGDKFIVLDIVVVAEMGVALLSFLAAFRSARKIAKKEKTSDVVSSAVMCIVPMSINFVSIGLFAYLYPQEIVNHRSASLFFACLPSFFNTYVVNISRTLGWRYSAKELIRRPETWIFSVILWPILLIPGMNPGLALQITTGITLVCLVFWFFSVTIAIKRLLNMPLFTVGKRQDSSSKPKQQ